MEPFPLMREKGLLSHCSRFIYTLRRKVSFSALLPGNLLAWLAWAPASFQLDQLVYMAGPWALCVFRAGLALAPHM